jgi:hypothetical protein
MKCPVRPVIKERQLDDGAAPRLDWQFNRAHGGVPLGSLLAGFVSDLAQYLKDRIIVICRDVDVISCSHSAHNLLPAARHILLQAEKVL